MGIRLTTKIDKISMKKYYLNIIKDKDQRIAELEQELAELKSKYEDCENERLQNRMDYLTMKNKWLNSEKKLAELKEKAIVPKFKIGQEVFIVDKNYFKIEHYKIAHCKVLGIEDKLDRKNNYVRWYTLKIYNSSYETDRRYKFKEKDVFATEQEALEKLKEIQGNE